MLSFGYLYKESNLESKGSHIGRVNAWWHLNWFLHWCEYVLKI